MSLCSSFVQTQENHWFRDPVVWGDDNSWFICWDDDDPIELVIKKASGLTVDDILKLLDRKGWQLRIMSKGNSGQRIFSRTGGHDFEEAQSWFLRQMGGAPTDEMFKGCEQWKEKPYRREGVWSQAGKQ